MKLFTLVYIYDRDVDVKIETFKTLEEAMSRNNEFVLSFVQSNGVSSLDTRKSKDGGFFCYVEGGHTNIQIHIKETEV